MGIRVCSMPGCQTSAGCQCQPGPFFLSPTPSPRYLPINMPFSNIGITIATLDGYGNVEIKVDQPYPAHNAEHYRPEERG